MLLSSNSKSPIFRPVTARLSRRTDASTLTTSAPERNVAAAKRGVAALKANARQFAANVRPIIEEITRAGFTSHNAIAAKLNERNVRTARPGTWKHVQVGAILRPFEASAGFAVP